MAIIGWKQFAQSFLRSAAESSIPVSRVVTLLKQSGISYRYGEMLKYYRSYQKITSVRNYYKYIPIKYRLPKNLFGKSHEFQSRNFLYEGVFKMINRATNEVFTKAVRLTSDNWLTPKLISEQAIEISKEGFDRYNWDITDFTITGAFTDAEYL